MQMETGYHGSGLVRLALRNLPAGLLTLLLAACGGGGVSVETAPELAPGGLTIAGSPASSVTAGSAYTFTPSVSGANNGALTFSVQNKPAWATFNAATGRLSGTPTGSGGDTYPGIVISVSDDVATASLAAFSITVTQIGTGSADVSWVPPTTNTDGSALTNLAGYRIYYGTSTTTLNRTVTVQGTAITTHRIENLGSGPWYFAVRAYNSDGSDSGPSNVASKTIP